MIMDQDSFYAASKATVNEKEVSLKQWLNSGIQEEGSSQEKVISELGPAKGKPSTCKTIVIPKFVDGERIESETTLTQWLEDDNFGSVYEDSNGVLRDSPAPGFTRVERKPEHEEQLYKCLGCPQTFESLQSLNLHVRKSNHSRFVHRQMEKFDSGRKIQFRDVKSLQTKYQYSKEPRTTRRSASAADWSFCPKKGRNVDEFMILDRAKYNQMDKDYRQFQEEQGLAIKFNICKSKPKNPLMGKSKIDRRTRENWVERFKNNKSDTVDLLLQGKSIFAKMEIPEDSANFWRKIFQEPKGIVDFIPPCPSRIHHNRRIRMDGIRDNGK